MEKAMAIRAAITMSVLIAVGFYFEDRAFAQQKEMFHGSELRTAHGAGMIVSASRRGTGDEVLRVRANREAVGAFLGKALPEKLEGERSLNYPFSLQIAPPLFRKQECRSTADSREAFETCFDANPSQQVGHWSVVQLPTLVVGQGNIGLRTKLAGDVFARCGTLPAEGVVLNCDVYFEQGGHWHELNTSSVALDHIEQFRCAALKLRNGVWPDAPSIPDECRN
jgi:hypothetical protein